MLKDKYLLNYCC